MASVSQSSWTFNLNGMNCVSSTKTNLFLSTNLRARPFRSLKISVSLNKPSEKSPPHNSSDSSERMSKGELDNTDSIKISFDRANTYKKSIQSNSNSIEIGNQNNDQSSNELGSGMKEDSASVKLAMEKARKYKKNKAIENNGGVGKNVGLTGEFSEQTKMGNLEERIAEKRVIKKEESTISSIDFMGLNFSDKKVSRGLPAGLVPMVDYLPEGDLPEVELIVGDSRKFEDATQLKPEQANGGDSDVYKPKVSTWGVFPRPSDISKTFGGGRVIRPGEVLETQEDKAAKDARTKKLLAAYKKKVGLSIDPKIKSECEKALKDGDYLMDLGKLKEALPYYEKVMNKVAYPSELHGLAALQWSICQDSLSRPDEARVMYERLQSHPNVQVSKKARQFMFGFEAMEMMKVTSSSRSPKVSGYQNYFEAFIEDKANYPLNENDDEEGELSQTLPYIILLVSPIFIVLLISLQKGLLFGN